MRLIDADALLEQYGLKDATKYGNESAEQQHKSYSTLMMYEIADMIYDAPTISTAANWTPCSVALPEEEIDCLITVLLDVEELQHRYNDFGHISKKTGRWITPDDEVCDPYRVIAWQPLPEPYRGEGE